MSVVHAADIAFASSAPPGSSGTGAVAMQLLFFAAIFAVFYFLLIRPQQKQRRDREQMLTALKHTAGGRSGQAGVRPCRRGPHRDRRHAGERCLSTSGRALVWWLR
jgi:Preprotein translocase subunit